MIMDADIPLLGAAYNALVENCIYQPDTETQREAYRVIKALRERLRIPATDDTNVAELLELFIRE